MSFEENFKQDQKDHDIKLTGDFFNLKEGDNKMRILAEPKIIVERFKFGICYKGAEYCQKEALEKAGARLQYRYLTWIVDRLDGTVKLFKMPYTIAKSLVDFKKAVDEGYDFESFPMPYDINIKAEGAGTKSVKYSVLPNKNSVPLTEDESLSLEKQTEIDDIIERMKQKQMDKISDKPKEALDDIEYPKEEQPEVTDF